MFCSDELAQSVVSKNSEPGVDSQFWLKLDDVVKEKKEEQCCVRVSVRLFTTCILFNFLFDTAAV